MGEQDKEKSSGILESIARTTDLGGKVVDSIIPAGKSLSSILKAGLFFVTLPLVVGGVVTVFLFNKGREYGQKSFQQKQNEIAETFRKVEVAEKQQYLLEVSGLSPEDLGLLQQIPGGNRIIAQHIFLASQRNYSPPPGREYGGNPVSIEIINPSRRYSS